MGFAESTPFKLLSGETRFSYQPPEIEIPEDLNQTLTSAKVETIRQRCLEDYRNSLITMETSIAQVCIHHPDGKAFITELNSRLLHFLECYAEVKMEEEGYLSSTTPANLRQDRITLKVNSILIDVFAQKREEIVEGRLNGAGNVGLNPLTIRQAICQGNLREMVYFPYKFSWNWMRLVCNDDSLLDKIDQKLRGRGSSWSLSREQMALTRACSALSTNEQCYGAFYYAIYARKSRSDQLRLENSPQEIARVYKQIPNLKNLRSLSRYASSVIYQETTLAPLFSQPLPWHSGSALFHPAVNRERPVLDEYLAAMEAHGFPVVAGICGSLDLIFTLAIYLGMNRREELEKGRLALLGAMIDGQDHSFQEVMMASKGFGLEQNFSPTAYRAIYPADASLVEQLRARQQAHHSELPDYFLSSDWFRQQAVEEQTT